VTEYLSEDTILEIYRKHIGPPTLRNPGGFSSAVARPMQSAFGEDAYPTLFLKAAALMQSLAENQSFVDGNKRIAWFAAKTFLNGNGFDIIVSADEANHLFRERVARGMTVEELATWLSSHSSASPSPPRSQSL
jgi:death-on-curing protein